MRPVKVYGPSEETPIQDDRIFRLLTVHLNPRPFTLNIDHVLSTTVYFNVVQNLSKTKNSKVLALETSRESTLLCLLIDVRTINLEKNSD